MKPGELYHCKIVGDSHGDGEYLVEIVEVPKGKTEFADIGMDKTRFDSYIFFYCIAASFRDYIPILLRSAAQSFEKTSVVRRITLDELPLFIGWHCTERYQKLLQESS